jgi:hypothetical protein
MGKRQERSQRMRRGRRRGRKKKTKKKRKKFRKRKVPHVYPLPSCCSMRCPPWYVLCPKTRTDNIELERGEEEGD